MEAYLGAAQWMPQLDDAWFNAGSLEMEQGSNLTRAAALLARAVCVVGRSVPIVRDWIYRLLVPGPIYRHIGNRHMGNRLIDL